MTTLTTTNFYTGKRREYCILRVSPTASKIVVARPEWKTGEMALTWKPSCKYWYNEYAGELYAGN